MQYLNAVSFAKKRIRNLAIFVVKKFIYKQHQILLHMYAIITKEIVNEALQIGNTKIHNAIISLMYTSSLDKDTIANLKVRDLINACSAYFNEDDKQTIEVLLGKDTSDMYPCWVLDSDGKHCVTFNTPVTSNYLFDYLKENIRYYDMGSNDFLFKIKHKGGVDFDKIDGEYISKFFNKKSTPLKELKSIPPNLKFTPIEFNKSFKMICDENLDVDDKSELIDLFMGNATDDNRYYQQYPDDRTSILEYYKKLLPYIELDNVVLAQQPVTQKPIPPQETTPSKEYDTEIIITVSKYYDNHVKDSSHTYEKYIYLTNYVHDVVVNGMELGVYRNISGINLDILFERAKIGWVFKQYSKPIHIEFCGKFDEDTINEILSILYDVGINQIVPIDSKEFIKCLDMIINPYFEYVDSITISSLELEQAVLCYI